MTTPRGGLTDAGPLFAMVDPKGQPEQYKRCVAVRAKRQPPLVTTWPCFNEAMFLANRDGGPPMQKQLWKHITADVVEIACPTLEQTARMQELMDRYDSLPMDLADASLVALSETEGYTEVFSVGSDFYSYRTADGGYLAMEPGHSP